MNVTVVGIGLIGGSIALSLKKSGFADTIIGVDNKPEHIIKALELKLVDKVLLLPDAIRQSDIIILATPVDSMATLLPHVLNQVDNQIVIEVGSTKKPIVESVRNHPKRSRYVATHPMAGTEYSGPEAAVPELFPGKSPVSGATEEGDLPAVAPINKRNEKA